MSDHDEGTAIEPADDPMPVFVLKAKDKIAPLIVARYAEACLARGWDDQAAEVERALDEINEWRERHFDLVKAPDHKHVPVAGMDATWILIGGHRKPDADRRWFRCRHCRSVFMGPPIKQSSVRDEQTACFDHERGCASSAGEGAARP